MIPFNKRVLIVGFGSVSQCTLPILLKHIRIPFQNITVIDFDDRARALRPWTDQGVKFVREKITPENLGQVLAKHVAAGDMLIDLAWNIDCCEILAVVPRPRRAVPQHVGRGVGPVRSRPVLRIPRSARCTGGT